MPKDSQPKHWKGPALASSKSASTLCPPTQPAVRSLLKSRSRSASRGGTTDKNLKGPAANTKPNSGPHTTATAATAGAVTGTVDPKRPDDRAAKYADAWGIHLLPLATDKPMADYHGTAKPPREGEMEKTLKDLIRREGSYIAASRRTDRTLSRRIESAQKASDLHEQRTGKRLRVTAQFVEEGMVYPEL